MITRPPAPAPPAFGAATELPHAAPEPPQPGLTALLPTVPVVAVPPTPVGPNPYLELPPVPLCGVLPYKDHQPTPPLEFMSPPLPTPPSEIPKGMLVAVAAGPVTTAAPPVAVISAPIALDAPAWLALATPPAPTEMVAPLKDAIGARLNDQPPPPPPGPAET